MTAPTLTPLQRQITSLLSKERAARRLGDDEHADYLNDRVNELLNHIPRNRGDKVN